jgi:hypothetical protein
MTTYKPATFVIDSIDAQFSGFTSGDLWNNWACPCFSKAEAERILSESRANGYEWHYNPNNDSFEVRHADDPEDYAPEVFQGITIVLNDGNSIRVYPVGTYSWTWINTNFSEG